MTTTELAAITATFQLADEAWGAELRRQFGKNAGDIRYTPVGHGATGSHLRKLYDARDKARKAFNAAWAERHSAA